MRRNLRRAVTWVLSAGLTAAAAAMTAASIAAPASSPNPPREAALETAKYNLHVALADVCFPYMFDSRPIADLAPAKYINSDAVDHKLAARGGKSFRVGTSGNVHVWLQGQGAKHSCTVSVTTDVPEEAGQTARDLFAERPEGFEPVSAEASKIKPAPHDVLCASENDISYLALVAFPKSRSGPLVVTFNRGPLKDSVCGTMKGSPNPLRSPAALETPLNNFNTALKDVCVRYIFERQTLNALVPSRFVNPDTYDARLMHEEPALKSFRVGTAGNVHVTLRSDGSDAFCTIAIPVDQEKARAATLQLLKDRDEGFAPAEQAAASTKDDSAHAFCSRAGEAPTYFALLGKQHAHANFTLTLGRSLQRSSECN